MSDSSAVDPYQPTVRRANLRLGLTIGAVVILLATAAIIKFTIFGLPVSKTEFERLQQQRSGFQPGADQLQGSEP